MLTAHRLTKLALVILAALILITIATGWTYQKIETLKDERAHPEPGILVEVGTGKMRVNCSGTGSPTVILESGLGDVSVEWQQVQSHMSERTRVCSYDRAGYGGSDEGPYPRTSRKIADELYQLLRNARVSPPFVLVGHSFGGYNVRVFASRHPADVAGIVLVDSVQEDEYSLLPPVWNRIGTNLLAKWRSQARWAPLQIGIGYTRIELGEVAHEPFFYLYLQPKYLRARANELENIRVSAEQAREAGNLGNIRLIVLTADASLKPVNGVRDADAEQYNRIWAREIQPMLARLSTRGSQIIVHSGHNIPGENPTALTDAISTLLDQASVQR